MLRTTSAAALAAAFIALAPLSLAAPAAEAASFQTSGFVKGNGWWMGWGGPWGGWHKPWRPPMHKVCFPDYERKKVWTRRHGWVWKTVYVGTKCVWRPAHRHRW